MNVIKEFQVGQRYTNDEIRFSLQLENLGGIRPSVDAKGVLRHLAIMTTVTDSERIISDNPYHDRIEGDILLYTAQGRQGDQQLTGRNKRLIEQYSIPVPFFGFINEGRQTYRFLGLLDLLRHYQEVQTDSRRSLRRVWLFEFRIHTLPTTIPLDQDSIISANLLAESRSLGSLSDLDREVADLSLVTDQTGGELLASENENTRAQLLQITPYKFEHLIRDVMIENGFSDVSVTPATNDGGIDINAYVDDDNDFFAGTHVQAQVKRWRHAVGSIEINKFRGALNTTAKGIFITTSHYTRGAILEARHDFKPSITLIDGKKLSSIIVRSKLNIESYL